VARGRGGKKKNDAKGPGAGQLVEQVLAPVAALIVVASAAVRAVVDRREAGPAKGQPLPAVNPPSSGSQPEEEKKSGFEQRLDRIGERFPPLGRALAVQQRYSEVRGNNIASAVTLQAFLSLFPLILVFVAVVGFISADEGTDVASDIVSALGLDGDAARAVNDAVATAERSRRTASVFGLAGLMWSGLGLVNALQYALNQVWQVEERGIKDKAVGIAWLAGAGLLLVFASALTTALRWLPGVLSPLGIVLSLGVNIALWLWTAKVLPNRDVGWRALLPGAILGGVGLEVLKVVGAYYVPRLVSSSSELYGSLGVVFAILAWLLFFGRLIVYSAVLNVVLFEKKRGTITTTIEVPAAPGVTPEDVTRTGRIEKEDIDPDPDPDSPPPQAQPAGAGSTA
jgi:membrane protein